MATFTNRATLSYNGRTTDSNTVVGTFLETLSVTKTALTDSYTADSRITYVINLTNSGTSPFTGLTVTDDLGAYPFGALTLYPLTYGGDILYYVNGVLQAEPTVAAGPPLVVSGINVPAGGNAQLVYAVDTNDKAPLVTGGTIVNTVTVSGGGLPEPVAASETVTVLDEANLTITKSLSPTAVSENGTVTYTFVIQNLGNTDAVATDNIVVSDAFDPILTLSAVTLNGAPLAEGTGYTYDEATGSFATVAGVITVPAATYTQQADGSYEVVPGEAVLVVTGTI